MRPEREKERERERLPEQTQHKRKKTKKNEAKRCEPHTRADYWLLTSGRDKTRGLEGPSLESLFSLTKSWVHLSAGDRSREVAV